MFKNVVLLKKLFGDIDLSQKNIDQISFKNKNTIKIKKVK